MTTDNREWVMVLRVPTERILRDMADAGEGLWGHAPVLGLMRKAYDVLVGHHYIAAPPPPTTGDGGLRDDGQLLSRVVDDFMREMHLPALFYGQRHTLIRFGARLRTALATPASAPPAAKGEAQRRATDAEIAEWLDRHDLRGTLPGSDARCAFEDAQSLCATVPTPPEPGSVAEDAELWKHRYADRRDVIRGWHERAVALGYDGVEELLAMALPSIVGSSGDERSPLPDAERVERAAKAIEEWMAANSAELWTDNYLRDLAETALSAAGTKPAEGVNPEAVAWQVRRRSLNDGHWYAWNDLHSAEAAEQFARDLRNEGHTDIEIRALGVIEPVGEKVDEAARLRELCACAYQAMGVHDAPVAWLDALSNAANGHPFSTDGLLPYTTPIAAAPQEDRGHG